jgi:hypothetical protein
MTIVTDTGMTILTEIVIPSRARNLLSLAVPMLPALEITAKVIPILDLPSFRPT